MKISETKGYYMLDTRYIITEREDRPGPVLLLNFSTQRKSVRLIWGRKPHISIHRNVKGCSASNFIASFTSAQSKMVI